MKVINHLGDEAMKCFGCDEIKNDQVANTGTDQGDGNQWRRRGKESATEICPFLMMVPWNEGQHQGVVQARSYRYWCHWPADIVVVLEWTGWIPLWSSIKPFFAAIPSTA